MPINDPSLPPADGRCLLFTLPRELRDEIYRHVLTFNGLQMIYYDRRDSSGYIMTMRFDVVQVDGNKFTNHAKVNPLKLVSKALYYEARGLEFYYNTVKFISRLCAVQEFVTVLQKYPKHWRDAMRHVILVGPWLQPRLTEVLLPHVLDFCRSHPHGSVILKLQSLDLYSDPHKVCRNMERVYFDITGEFPKSVFAWDFWKNRARSDSLQGGARGSRSVELHSTIDLPENFHVFIGCVSFAKVEIRDVLENYGGNHLNGQQVEDLVAYIRSLD